MSTSDDHPDAAGDDTPVSRVEPPLPEATFKLINPVISALLRSPLHGLVSDNLMLITFTGRRSGDEYTTPVGYHQDGDTLTVFTHSPWWKNLEGGQPVTVHLRGETRRGLAEPIADPAEVAAFAREFLDANGIDAARRIGLDVEGDDLPTLAELEAGVRGTVVIQISLDHA